MCSLFGRNKEVQSTRESQPKHLSPRFFGFLMLVTLLAAGCAPPAAGVPPAPVTIVQEKNKIVLNCAWGSKTDEALISNVQLGKTYDINGFIGFKIGENGLIVQNTNPVHDSSFKSVTPMDNGRKLVIETETGGLGQIGAAVFTATLESLINGGQNLGVVATCKK